MEYPIREKGGARSSIWLSEPLRAWLDAEAKKHGTTTAEVIRTAVRELKRRAERQDNKGNPK
jgi:Arc/MetJ-type ribon-helix-helix transcriptional regulator